MKHQLNFGEIMKKGFRPMGIGALCSNLPFNKIFEIKQGIINLKPYSPEEIEKIRGKIKQYIRDTNDQKDLIRLLESD